MSMSTRDIDWEILSKKILERETLFPNLDGRVSAAISDMRTVWALHADRRFPDRRLFGLDLENLASGLDMLTELARAGVQDERMDEGVRDVRALARDMQARARAIIDDRLTDTLVHTSVASLGLRSTEPHPESASAQAIVLKESETQTAENRHAPLTSIAISAPGVGGRILGEFASARVVDEVKFKHVKPDLFFLPAGRVLTVSIGEAVALWQGETGEPVPDVLKKPAYRIEPISDVVEVEGPVFVSQTAIADPFISKHDHFTVEEAPNQFGENFFDFYASLLMPLMGTGIIFMAKQIITSAEAQMLEADPNYVSPFGDVAPLMQGALYFGGFACTLGILLTLIKMGRGMQAKENPIRTFMRARRNKKIIKLSQKYGVVPVNRPFTRRHVA